ncbi:UNVERIFIED_CONTAM: putative late blight resistance proteinR1A-4 [Sesamum angustifolium]|uniref:Late blight resistance proteinR1A-4 n=1 Tax=Sesamum angustifolium TaxID=2727405 RepID=A0AAW2QAG3_9LAMI
MDIRHVQEEISQEQGQSACQSCSGKHRVPPKVLSWQAQEETTVSTGYGKQSLECRIRDAAYDAEDILESQLSDKILSSRKGGSFIFSPPDLEKVIGELDSAVEEMMMTIMNNSQTADSSSPAVSSSKQDPNPKNIIVGVGEYLIQLKDRLTGQPSNALQVIPIVGMGGIGKTTLAQNLYDDPSVISHFDTRAWVTISQDYNKQKLQYVLLSLLSCVIGKPKDEMLGFSFASSFQRFFPDENNGSRIIVTTRESSVADYTGSGSSHHQMNLLKDDESWNLLHQKVFAPEDTCTPQLEKVGKKIAKDCRGLPLSIHVIGGILSQAKTSQDFWERVSDNTHQFISSRGIRETNFRQSLEEAAKMHLKALVDRNLIFVHQQKTNGNVKSYSIHDLLRDLYVRKAHEEKFLFVDRWADNDPGRSTSCWRRVCYHGPFSTEDAYILTEQIRLARSFLLFDRTGWSVASPVVSNLRLLRVLDILRITFHQFPEETLQLVNLRKKLSGLLNFLMESSEGGADQASGWMQVKKKHRSNSKFSLHGWVEGLSGKQSASNTKNRISLTQKLDNNINETQSLNSSKDRAIHDVSNAANSLSISTEDESVDHYLDKCVVSQNSGDLDSSHTAANTRDRRDKLVINQENSNKDDVLPKIKWGDLDEGTLIHYDLSCDVPLDPKENKFVGAAVDEDKVLANSHCFSPRTTSVEETTKDVNEVSSEDVKEQITCEKRSSQSATISGSDVEHDQPKQENEDTYDPSGENAACIANEEVPVTKSANPLIEYRSDVSVLPLSAISSMRTSILCSDTVLQENSKAGTSGEFVLVASI